MFNSFSWQSHNEYYISFKNFKAKLSSDMRALLWNNYSRERHKLMSLNLDTVGDYLSQFYSATGRPARHQAQILRSIILFTLLFNRTDARLCLTVWVREVLPSNPVFIALIGCRCADDLPPLGSYYDFMNRLWNASRDNYSRTCLLSKDKNGKKPKKVIGPDGKLIEPEPDTYATKDMVERIFHGESLSDGKQDILQTVFSLAAVLPSINNGLIPLKELTVSGDGTAVKAHADPFGRSPQYLKSLPEGTCTDNIRHYSDPDASWGWDSHEKHWYFGRTLYMLVCRNPELSLEVPLLLNFTSAKRHDSINFLFAIDAFGRQGTGLSPKNLCLDSAHDNISTYKLLDRWDINALIDINKRGGSADGLPDDVSLDKEAHPLCRAGLRMCSWGYDKNKDARKFRCPLACGRVQECPFSPECKKSSYGRTVYIKNSSDLRFHPRIPRDSEQYKTIYNERSACERMNDRVLNNYHLQELRIRGDDHFAFWTMIIGICIHLDAWYKMSSRTGQTP